MKYLAFVFLLIASCALMSPPRGIILRKAATSAVIVHGAHGRGSGTVVGKAGSAYIVLTCAHVIKDETDLAIATPRGDFPAVLDKVDEARDLATLLVAGDLGIKPMRVAMFEPNLYETLYVMSSPLGIPQTGSEGVLYSKNRSLGEPTPRWAFTGFMLPGSSGGTITNIYGELVCVAEAIHTSEITGMVPELGYCVGLQDIKFFLSEYRL